MTCYPQPRPGEYIRDAERHLAQARDIVARAQDDPHAFPPAGQDILAAIRDHLALAMAGLGDLADLDTGRAGSAVPVPPQPSNGGHLPFGLPATPRVPSFASYEPTPLPLRRAAPGVLDAAGRAAGGWDWGRS